MVLPSDEQLRARAELVLAPGDGPSSSGLPAGATGLDRSLLRRLVNSIYSAREMLATPPPIKVAIGAVAADLLGKAIPATTEPPAASSAAGMRVRLGMAGAVVAERG